MPFYGTGQRLSSVMAQVKHAETVSATGAEIHVHELRKNKEWRLFWYADSILLQDRYCHSWRDVADTVDEWGVRADEFMWVPIVRDH